MRRIVKPTPAWELGAQVWEQGRTAPLVIRVTPWEVEIRQKGRRHGYSLPWEAVYRFAVLARAEELRRERKAALKEVKRRA